MPKIRVLEVATFYTMFHLEPVGAKAHIQVCGTTPCWLRGADELKAVCRRRIGGEHHVSADGDFSWEEVECLGACVNAPLVQIGADTYEDLTAESFEKILDDIAAGRPLTPGPQTDRQYSAPVGGPTTLTEDPAAAQPAAEAPAPVAEGGAATAGAAGEVEAVQPKGLDAPRNGEADDLKRISGIGPKIETMLNERGIFHFDQIAGWTGAEIAWVDNDLSFKGRIEREDWIGQAKKLAAGEKGEGT